MTLGHCRNFNYLTVHFVAEGSTNESYDFVLFSSIGILDFSPAIVSSFCFGV